MLCTYGWLLLLLGPKIAWFGWMYKCQLASVEWLACDLPFTTFPLKYKEVSLPADKKLGKHPTSHKGLWSPRNNLPWLQHPLYEYFMLTDGACPFTAKSLLLYHNNSYLPLCSLWRRKGIPFFVHRAVESFVPSIHSMVQGWQCGGVLEFTNDGIWAHWHPGALGRFLLNRISWAISSWE